MLEPEISQGDGQEILELGEFMCVGCVEFADDGSVSAEPMYWGTRKDCEKFADRVEAIACSIDKPVKEAWCSIIKTQDWFDNLESSRVKRDIHQE